MLHVSVVTPERQFLEVDCEELSVPGQLGYLGILPGHTPLLTGLKTGEMSYRVGQRWSYLLVSGGFCEVADDKVTILADLAERPAEIDVVAAEHARASAEERLKLAADRDFKLAQAELELAVTRIQVSRRQ